MNCFLLQVVIQYFEPTTGTCLLIPWFREMGFAVVYGTLILKVYRLVSTFEMSCMPQTHVSYLGFVIVIPKEGFVGRAPPIILLV